MYETFYALPSAKQERIRNAAFREFGRFGFKKTSTEQIAVAADISKGMVFHYFGSKRGLFEYLLSYATEDIAEWLTDVKAGLGGKDYIEQYRYTTEAKLKAMLAKPQLFEFLTMVYLHVDATNISPVAHRAYEKLIAMRDGMIVVMQESGNTDHFRDDIDIEKAKRYMGWLIDGYSQHLVAALGDAPLADMDLDPYLKEFHEILDDLKRLMYKRKKA